MSLENNSELWAGKGGGERRKSRRRGRRMKISAYVTFIVCQALF